MDDPFDQDGSQFFAAGQAQGDLDLMDWQILEIKTFLHPEPEERHFCQWWKHIYPYGDPHIPLEAEHHGAEGVMWLRGGMHAAVRPQVAQKAALEASRPRRWPNSKPLG